MRLFRTYLIEDVIKAFEAHLNSTHEVTICDHRLEPAEVLKAVDFELFLSELDKYIKMYYTVKQDEYFLKRGD